jgi:hypothetical protein
MVKMSVDRPCVPLQVFSDLHLEFIDTWAAELKTLVPAAPNLALLGDIVNLNDHDMAAHIIEDVCFRWDKVFYVVGNHEFYHGNGMEDDLKFLKSLESVHKNFKVLDNEGVSLGDVRVFGGTMWSMVSPENIASVERHLNDYHLIPGFTVELNNELHRIFMEDLTLEIKQCLEEGKDLVVLTHHAPLLENTSHMKYLIEGRKRGTNQAFATDLSECMEKPIVFWGFGHTHYCCDFMYGNVRIYSNAKGYGGNDLRSKIHFNRGKILMI